MTASSVASRSCLACGTGSFSSLIVTPVFSSSTSKKVLGYGAHYVYWHSCGGEAGVAGTL